MGRYLVVVTFVVTVLATSPTFGQGVDSLAHYGVSPEKLADVILVLEPHATFPLDVPLPVERVVSGSILRVEKGVVPQVIVNTPITIVAPLKAGVPVKLFLKAFKDRNVHYIIAVFPESHGGKP